MKIFHETLVTLVDINEPRTVPELGGQIHSTKGNGCCRLHTEQERCHWLGRVSEIDQKKGKFKLQWGSRGDLEEMNEGY